MIENDKIANRIGYQYTDNWAGTVVVLIGKGTYTRNIERIDINEY